MIVEKLELTGELEEILGHRANPFPHSNFYVDCARYIGGYVPWHWHSDIEIFWVMQGTVKLTTSQGSYTIQQGEAVFLNSDTLHLQEPISPRPVLLTQVFDASLIAGTPGSVFAQKYVNPVLEAHQLDALIFQPVQPNHRHLINAIRQAYDLADLQEPGYEISVRNQLSEAWLTIFQEAQKQLHTKRSASSVGEERLKTMMQYIHSRYHEKISLADIAASASVSDREALRSFRRWLQKTPFQYLTEIRIRSARRLLRETTRQVTDIAYECGFSSPSYFGKFIKEKLGGRSCSTRDNVKYGFFAYNGIASGYKTQAMNLGFTSAQANNGEGSPYVMNRYDKMRDPTVAPTSYNKTWGQIKRDGGPIEYPADGKYGAYVVYCSLL